MRQKLRQVNKICAEKTGQTSLQEESQPIQLAASKFAPVADMEEGKQRRLQAGKERGGVGGVAGAATS